MNIFAVKKQLMFLKSKIFKMKDIHNNFIQIIKQIKNKNCLHFLRIFITWLCSKFELVGNNKDLHALPSN